MAITTTVPDYAGQTPVIGQPQPEFNQNTADIFDYIGSVSTSINDVAGEMNSTATQVNNDASSASSSASSAAASADEAGAFSAGIINFAGDFVVGVTSAVSGSSYRYDGGYWTCVANTTSTPSLNNSAWRKVIGQDDIDAAEERAIGAGVSIFRGSNGSYVQNGDTVPIGTTHLAVLIGGKVEDLIAWDSLILPATINAAIPTEFDEYLECVISTDNGSFSFVSEEVKDLRNKGLSDGWGLDSSGSTDSSPQLSRMVNSDVSATKKINGLIKVSNTVEVTRNLVLDVSHAEFVMDGIDVIFSPNGIDILEIYGGKYSASEYVQNRPHVVRGEQSSSTLHPSRLIIEKTSTFNVGLCEINLNKSSGRVFAKVSGNEIISDDNTDTYVTNSGTDPLAIKPWISISAGDLTDASPDADRYNHLEMSGNNMDVFHQSGLNVDGVKISGVFKGPKVDKNDFTNRNPLSEMEIDTFTGGYKISFKSNDLHNANFKSQTLKGSLTSGAKSWFVDIDGNTFTFDDGSVSRHAIVTISALLKLRGNTVHRYDTHAASDFTAINPVTGDLNENPFSENRPTIVGIHDNLIDVDYGTKDPGVTFRGISLDKIKVGVASGNVIVGGDMIVNDANKSYLSTCNYIMSDKLTADDNNNYNNKINSVNDIIGSSFFATTTEYNLWNEQSVPTDAGLVRVTLDNQPDNIGNEFCLYLLHVLVQGGSATNTMTFIVSNGGYLTHATKILPIYSRLDPFIDNHNVFELGVSGAGIFYLDSTVDYSLGNTPTTMKYMFEKMTASLPSSI